MKHASQLLSLINESGGDTPGLVDAFVQAVQKRVNGQKRKGNVDADAILAFSSSEFINIAQNIINVRGDTERQKGLAYWLITPTGADLVDFGLYIKEGVPIIELQDLDSFIPISDRQSLGTILDDTYELDDRALELSDDPIYQEAIDEFENTSIKLGESIDDAITSVISVAEQAITKEGFDEKRFENEVKDFDAKLNQALDKFYKETRNLREDIATALGIKR